MLCLLLPAVVMLSAGCGKEPEGEFQTDLFAMDTFMTMKCSGSRAEDALQQAKEEILRLEKLLDVNNENSDVYRVNHHSGETVAVSADTAELAAEALSYGGKTEGALDISIYPVLKEWGFTTDTFRIPEDSRISELLGSVDYRRVRVDRKAHTITLPEGWMIDLGAVAKGYAGDRICGLLRENGVTSGLINLGGNVMAVGSKPDGSAWRVGIRDPLEQEGTVGTVSVRNQAVVTSGSYERFFVGEDGKTYWHILDPQTGYPAEGGLVSVTVVGDSGLMCDALSTALFVMGKEKAIAYCRRETQAEFILIDRDRHVYLTPGLTDRLELSEGVCRTVIDREKT